MIVEKKLLEAINNINDKERVIELLGGVTVDLAIRDDNFAKLMLARVKAKRLDLVLGHKDTKQIAPEIMELLEDAKHAKL